MLTNKIRKDIVKAAKRNEGWNNYESGKREVNQDKLLKVECEKRGYTLSDFYAEDGKKLNKLLQ